MNLSERLEIQSAIEGERERMDEFKELADRLLWRPIDTAPKDAFILLYCREDNSRWLAKWQGGVWFGVDDMGLTREGHSAGDTNYVTGWFVDAWMPLPNPPYRDGGHDRGEHEGCGKDSERDIATLKAGE